MSHVGIASTDGEQEGDDQGQELSSAKEQHMVAHLVMGWMVLVCFTADLCAVCSMHHYLLATENWLVVKETRKLN